MPYCVDGYHLLLHDRALTEPRKASGRASSDTPQSLLRRKLAYHQVAKHGRDATLSALAVARPITCVSQGFILAGNVQSPELTTRIINYDTIHVVTSGLPKWCPVERGCGGENYRGM